MPPRSRDVAALRRFAEAHAAAHARAAAVRPDAACSCRQQRCVLHEGTRVTCGGVVVLVLRHDPSVGQVWTLSEVCSVCAPLMPHTRVLGRAAPLGQPPEQRSAPVAPAPRAAPPRLVPGGFSGPPVGDSADRETRGRRGRR
ncbi:hypothetical protein [Streptomyces sp. NPDC002088]|uniref:hypothetical protein n=1 Tax=Streptomyces sp. NPDC002088 TaxID=3154665 RepID=UPI003327A264